MKQKIILWSSIGGALLLLVVCSFLLFRNGKIKYDFRYDSVSEGDMTVYVTATGTINPVTSIDVGTQVSGIIVKLYADYNSVVKKGQVIARIDTTFLIQSVKDAQATLDKTKAQFADGKRSLDRAKELLARQLMAQSDYDATLTTYEVNEASLKSAQASLDRAYINLQYATIYAPIDGVVINRAVNIGQTVAASLSSPTLYTIANDLRKMQVETTVDESDIGRISIGQEGTFTVDAYPESKFSGTISQIRLAPTTVSNVVNYIVIIDVNNSDLKLMPGMTANVKIMVGSSLNVMRVATTALRLQPPAELIDSTKLMHRGASSQNGGTGQGTAPANQFSGNQNGNSTSPLAGIDRTLIHAVRDSINKVHGGSMSREDLMAEMQKYFAKKGLKGRASQKAQPLITRVRTSTTFGITQTFPEYEKSPYIVDHESGFGRVWILNADKKLEPVYVRTGLSDGKFTEITSSKLKPGDQIILGVTNSNGDDAANQQLRSPLSTPQGQGAGMRGMR
jgi:HlyD family secretion protein